MSIFLSSEKLVNKDDGVKGLTCTSISSFLKTADRIELPQKQKVDGFLQLCGTPRGRSQEAGTGPLE